MISVSKRVGFFTGLLSIAFLLLEFFSIKNSATTAIPVLIHIKFAVGLFTVCCGIFCSYFYIDSKTTRPIIYFIYFIAITYSNLNFNYEFNYYSVKISRYAFDTFGTFSVITLLHFLRRCYPNNSRTKAFNKVAYVLYCSILLALFIKYLLIICIKKFDIFNNPLDNIIQIIIIMISFMMLLYFVFLLATSSRTATMLLRYLVLGIFYVIFPYIIIFNKVLIRHLGSLNYTETLYVNLCFIYLPIILSASVFQFRSEKTNKAIRNVIIFLGYSTTMVLTIQMVYVDFSSYQFKVASAITSLISPSFYFLVYSFVNRFLSLENRAIHINLMKFQEEMNDLVTSQESYILTASRVKELFKSEYVFYSISKPSGNTIPYTDTTDEIMNIQLEKSLKNEKKDLIIFENGGFCLNYFFQKTPIFKIFCGPKINKDEYLPSELSLMKRYSNILFEKILKDFNQSLSTELQEVSEHSKKMDKEIMLASHVQKSFYPQQIDKPQGWDLKFYCKAMAGVSGDLYDFFMTGNKLEGIGIFDVSGHGISSGLVAMLVRNIIHQEFYKNKEESLDKVLKLIDSRFKQEKNNIENFMTGILMRISGNNIQLVNGAHPDPILYKKSDNSIHFLTPESKKRGTIIGLDGIEPEFPIIDFTMESGDELILYTDGINEAINEDRKQYGLKHLLEIAKENINQTTENQLNLILNDLQKYVGDAQANDDITLIILQKE